MSGLRVLQVSTADAGGGAEAVARSLHRGYLRRGHDAWLAVGRRVGDDPRVVVLDDRTQRGAWAGFWDDRAVRWFPPDARSDERASQSRTLVRSVGRPSLLGKRLAGSEDFDHPASRRLLAVAGAPPDVVHCHNLHGEYFDLRVLPAVSQQVPTFVTLHDMWLFTGHCAYSLDSDRWEIGCGHCPHLDSPPRIRTDGSARNWRRKAELHQRSRLFVAAPSRWLLDRARRSSLGAAMAASRVVHNGVDLTVFQPGDRLAERHALGLPPDAAVGLFVGNELRRNPYKDFATVRRAAGLLAARMPDRRIVVVCVGQEAPTETVGGAELRSVGYLSDEREVARWYRAADVFLHAARADNFPNTVLEALASGLPVVATAVGGIPEQVTSHTDDHARGAATGVLVPLGDAEAMATAAASLLADDRLRSALATNARADAERRFDLERQIDQQLDWYREGVASCAA